MLKIILYTFCFIWTFNLYSEFENSYTFLKMPETGSAEITSLSGISVADGLLSVYANPAGFSSYNSKGILISDTENLADTRKFSLFYGSSMKYFNFIGGIKYFYLKTPINDNINYNAYSFNTLFSKKLFNTIECGITLKYIYSSIFTYTASLFLINTGVNYKTEIPMILGSKKNFTAGLFIKDIGIAVKNYNKDENIPYEVNFGIKYLYITSKVFESHILVNYNSRNIFSAGINFKIFQLINTGLFYKKYAANDYIFIDIGVKFYLKNFYYGFYYNIGVINDLSNTHSISLSIEL